MASRIQNWANGLYTGKRSYDIVGKRRILYFVSAILISLCLISILLFKFNLGIEFRGGSEFKITNISNTAQQPAIDAIHKIDSKQEPLVSVLGNSSIRIQTNEISDTKTVEKIRDALAKAYNVKSSEITNTLIGPSWGSSVSIKALQGLIVFLIVVAGFMAIYFRNMRMSIAGILALFHDLIITVGVYAASRWEITPASMIGFLTILGYSMYDTVVVFDKVRENTRDYQNQTRTTYAGLANLAVNQTLIRSINTSIVALLPVSAILVVGVFLLGAGTVRDIALALFIGMFVGAYSSIFLATPLAVTFASFSKKIKQHDKLVYKTREEISKLSGGEDIDIKKEVSAKLLPGRHLGSRKNKS